jgi:hypothetical protein
MRVPWRSFLCHTAYSMEHVADYVELESVLCGWLQKLKFKSSFTKTGQVIQNLIYT